MIMDATGVLYVLMPSPHVPSSAVTMQATSDSQGGLDVLRLALNLS